MASAEVLPISRDYFRLRRPIDRRLYELARKHCGRQTTWRIGIDLLQKKCGSRQQAKHFAAHLRDVLRTNHLPDYALRLDDGQAVFMRKAAASRPETERPPVTPDTQAGSPPRGISSRAMEELSEVAPGWDRYALEAMYLSWADGKEPARNEDARFLAWARSFTKGRAA